MLILKNVTIAIENKLVVKDFYLSVFGGSTILIQGENGSGKSSLLNALAGHPFYALTAEQYIYNEKNFLSASALERAQAGVFLVPQYSPALPGVQFSTFLQESFRALNPVLPLEDYQARLEHALIFLQITSEFMTKPVHEHFSGGEKKRCEMIQLMVLRPSLVLLDEIDSGLDAQGVALFINLLDWYKKVVPHAIVVVVTHSESLAGKIIVDAQYVMNQGRLHEAS